MVLLDHILMLIFVLCDENPTLLHGVFLIVDSFLHSFRVYGLGKYIQLILKHVQHGVDHDRTTNVLFHVMCAQLQVILGDLSPYLLHVSIDLYSDLVLGSNLSEGTD